MGAQECRGDAESRRVSEQVAAVVREIRLARLRAGLTQTFVARHVGIDQSRLSRTERGVGHPDLELLARLCGVVGLELGVRAYPGRGPLRDAAHIALLERLRAAAAADLTWRSEVPLPVSGDRRAWDRVAVDATGRALLAVEAETRLRDVQATIRAIAIKKRDSAMPCVALLLADTRSNRAAIRSAADYLRDAFPVATREALADLGVGRAPRADALILL